MRSTAGWVALVALSCQGAGQPMPDGPTVARDDHLSIPEDGELALSLLGENDDVSGYNPMSFDPPSNGSLGTSSLGGAVYRPNPGFHGRVQFRYRYSDGASAVAFIDVISDGTPYEEGKYLIKGDAGGDVELADIDDDGRLDIVVLNEDGSDVAIGLNQTVEAREFEVSVHRFEAGRRPSSLGVGDLDGDGLLDIVIAARDDDEIVILAGRELSPLKFDAPLRLSTAPLPVDLELADVNDDGRLDLLAVSRSTASLSVFINESQPGSVGFGERFVFDAPESPVTLTTADFDGDGVDVAVAGDSGDLAIYVNATAIGDSVPVFDRQVDRATGRGPVALSATDLDGDGALDLAVANRDDQTLWIARNAGSGGSFELVAAEVVALPPQTRTLLPLPREDGVDLVIAADSGISLMRSASGLSFETRPVRLGVGASLLSLFSFRPAGIARGDLDGDGIDEIVFGQVSFEGGVLVAYDRPELGP